MADRLSKLVDYADLLVEADGLIRTFEVLDDSGHHVRIHAPDGQTFDVEWIHDGAWQVYNPRSLYDRQCGGQAAGYYD